MAQAGQPTVMMQGIETPVASVDPEAFFRNTRRLLYPMQSITSIAGLGSSNPTQLRQTGIIAGLEIRVTGTLVFGGTITNTVMSWRWPYNLIKALRVSANGQANLINCNGLQLKARAMMQPDSQDRGVLRTVNDVATVQHGTLSQSSEDWGTSSANLLGPNRTVPATGTYTVDLSFFVPLAFDSKTLLGAIYAQTAATALSLDIDWETQANLVTLGGAATLTDPATTLDYQVNGIVYSIPNVGGKFVVPDLSAFHSLIGFRTSALGQGDNEILLPGTGIGRQLMRVFYQVSTGTAPGTPLAMNETNFGQQAWRYGGNDTPELVQNGRQLRYLNERLYNSDIGKNWGFGSWDFANEWAFRDSVDEGTTSDLRLLINLVNTPTTPFAEIVQETIFAAPVGA